LRIALEGAEGAKSFFVIFPVADLEPVMHLYKVEIEGSG
jgi:hypothetical protein